MTTNNRTAANNADMDESDLRSLGVDVSRRQQQAWLPDGYSQIFRSYVFGPSGFWTMGPLRYAEKVDPFLSLDCAPHPPPWHNPRKGRESNFAIWQPLQQRNLSTVAELSNENSNGSNSNSAPVHTVAVAVNHHMGAAQRAACPPVGSPRVTRHVPLDQPSPIAARCVDFD